MEMAHVLQIAGSIVGIIVGTTTVSVVVFRYLHSNAKREILVEVTDLLDGKTESMKESFSKSLHDLDSEVTLLDKRVIRVEDEIGSMNKIINEKLEMINREVQKTTNSVDWIKNYLIEHKGG